MSLLQRLRRPRARRRVCCIGLDGTPHGLLLRLLAQGAMPNFARLAREGNLMRMRSVHPWVSSVAWTTLQTGVNPGKHGVFGFVDRHPDTLKPFIPLSDKVKWPSLWDVVGQAGRQVVVLNVPVTYPVRPVNGVLVAGFLAPTLNERAVYPTGLLPRLGEMGYRIDSDAKTARAGRRQALEDLEDALEKRTQAFLYLMDSQPWDLFLGVLMETDRLHHFFFDEVSEDGPVQSPAFLSIYGRADRFLGQVLERLGDDDVLVVLSDHGACAIRQEVYYNHWLAGSGYLRYAQTPARSIADLDPQSVAYGMDPARIFVNLKGRERDGRVSPGEDYERARTELIEAAEALEIGDGDGPVRPVVRAYRREEIYSGPYVEQAADIILAPREGYDPKGAFYRESLTGRDGALVGMHSYDDAFVYLSAGGARRESADLVDVTPTVLELMDVPAPAGLDGTPLV
ncbi:MAG: hypothetical protein HPY83_06460 [Anaerolineae bacterium]|nr:hypothetical protein [Anaerolineae bacterium]